MDNLTAALMILYNQAGFALDEPMTAKRAELLRNAMRMVELALPTEA